MKKNEIKDGGMYRAKVSDKVVTVRIDSTHTKGGWNATNTATGKRIRIKSAQRLRGAAKSAAKGGTKTKTTTKATTKKAKSTKAKRVSALDAAAQVLAKASKPMRAKELIASMAEQNLWKSPAGRTPHATLYAAMLRESRDKGTSSRFKRVDRGQFAYNG